MPKPFHLADTEWMIMEVIWEHYPISVGDILRRLPKGTGFSRDRSTIQTHLHRLKEKQAVTSARDGRSSLYSPMVSREMCVEAEAEKITARLPSKALPSFLRHFLRNSGLASEDLDQLEVDLQEEDPHRDP